MIFAFAEAQIDWKWKARFQNIWALLFHKKPELTITPTTKVIFGENKIVFLGDFHLETTGSLYLNAQKHIIVNSGQGIEPERPDYRHSVWINSQLDHQNRPLKTEIIEK